MELAELHVKELLLLGHRGHLCCRACYDNLLHAISGENSGLRQHLSELAACEARQQTDLDKIYSGVDWPRLWHLDERAITRILRNQMPSVARGAEVSEIELPEALNLVRSSEEEVAAFFQELARATTHADIQELFSRRAEHQVEHKRQTLALGDNAPEPAPN